MADLLGIWRQVDPSAHWPVILQSPASVKDSIKHGKIESDKGGQSTLIPGLHIYTCVVFAPKSYTYTCTQAHIYRAHTYINCLIYFDLKD